MKKEIIATIIFLMLSVVISTWLVINQGRLIQEMDEEIRELQAGINDLEFYVCMLESEVKDNWEINQKGRIITSPYVVKGQRYVPMSLTDASTYSEQGLASWYGNESGYTTANGEAFNPEGISGAHKYLPIPTDVKITNLENNRSIIVRVNDRGPFVPGRIIDLSAGAAKQLGFYHQGIARVLVETAGG